MSITTTITETNRITSGLREANRITSGLREANRITSTLREVFIIVASTEANVLYTSGDTVALTDDSLLRFTS
jgi:hypothetical protein